MKRLLLCCLIVFAIGCRKEAETPTASVEDPDTVAIRNEATDTGDKLDQSHFASELPSSLTSPVQPQEGDPPPCEDDPGFDSNSPDLLGIGIRMDPERMSIDTRVDEPFVSEPINQRPVTCNSTANDLFPLPEQVLFRGVDYVSSFDRVNRPDTDIAVGPRHIVHVTNRQIAFLNRIPDAEGDRLFFQQNLKDFLPQTEPPSGANSSGGVINDPRVIYDHHSGRFVITCIEVGQPPGPRRVDFHLHVAVSETADPHGVWHQIRFDNTYAVANEASHLGDQPELGFDENGWYLSILVAGFGCEKLGIEGFYGTAFYAIEKADFLDPADTSVRVNQIVRPGIVNARVAQSFGSNAAPFAVGLRPDEADSTLLEDKVTVLAFENPFSETPGDPVNGFKLIESDLGSIELVDAYELRMDDVPNGTGAFSIQAGGVQVNQVQRVVFRDGSLWACYVINSDEDRAAVRWYEFDVGNWPTSGPEPSVIQTGDIAPAQAHATFPSLAVNAEGDTGFVYAQSSDTPETGRFAVKIGGRLESTDPGTLDPFFAEQMDISTIDFFVQPGDYFDIVSDPVDDEKFWFTGNVYVECLPGEPVAWETVIGTFEIFLLGDVNCDGEVNLLDVQPFVDILTGQAPYTQKADFDKDGAVTLLDVQPFVDLVSGN
ncbi:MAG: dockerin type I domain-containing protein [Planctomycetota bacterium]